MELESFLDQVIEGDCLEVMEQMPGGWADMVFFDPPYFLQLPKKRLIRWEVGTLVEGVNDEWDKFLSFKEYDDFIEKVLAQIKQIMKPQATIWAIGTYHNIFRIGKIMQDLGFWMLNDVIWVKTNPMPNWLNVRFTNATETVIWAVKDKKAKGYTYHPEIARGFENSKIASSVWRIPLCTGTQRLKDENKQKVHPTQKPEELMRRIILVSTNEGDIVFDPVAGTGTTGVVARKLGRRFVMVEKEPRYVEAINKRLKSLQPQLGGLHVA